VVLRIVLFLGLPVGAAALSGAFLYTEAPQYDVQAMLRGGERFPAAAAVKVFSGGASRLLAPSLAISADAALSPDGQSVLLSGKQRAGQPWQIWEVPLAGGAPRQVTFGTDDCIRPFYAAERKFIYARKTPQGFQIEIAPLQAGDPLRLTWLAGNFLPDGIMRDGRVLFEADFPSAPSTVRELYTVYTDGSGVETRRCDHGPDRHSAAELATGDLVFQTGSGLARFSSARAGQLDLALPKGQYVGPVAEVEGGEWLAAYRAGEEAAYWICRFPPLQAAQPVKVVGPNAFQPVPVRVRPVPPYHPSGLGNREGANLLCLNSYVSKSQQIPENSVAEVRVWSRNSHGGAIVLGKAPVERDGSFYVQAPSEAPLRFELLDREGKTIAAEKGWFWTRKGEQRVCVGCHAGPERAPDNVVPQVLLRTQKPVPMFKPVD
jgi:Hydrazine synthase alpha subunit middle domain